MAQYIPRDALLAEIERRMKLRYDSYKTHKTLSDFIAWEELEYFKEEFLPTLEVKEVELDEHQIADIIQNLFPTDQFIESETLLLNRGEALKFAKHFFELGLKAQKGE